MRFFSIIKEIRLITIALLFFMCIFAWDVYEWFSCLKEPNNSQGAFASAVVLACVAAIRFWTDSHSVPKKQEGENEEL